MSVWTEVEGKILIKKTSGLSIKDLIPSYFDEVVDLHISQKNLDFYRITVEVSFLFSEEGMYAVDIIKRFINTIKSRDIKASVEITAKIQFS